MGKLNFRIVEGDYEDVDYDSFKKDYMDMFIPKSEILKKYDLSHARYLRYARMVTEETGFKRMRGVNPVGFMTHIRDCHNGKFRVDKQLNGKKLYCGTYDSLEKARMVRDYLVHNNWSEDAIEFCVNGGIV